MHVNKNAPKLAVNRSDLEHTVKAKIIPIIVGMCGKYRIEAKQYHG